MRHKLIIILALSIIFTTLSACADEGGQFMNPVIESSSVEIGTVQNPNDGLLHFLVQIYDSGMEPDQAYKVRFIIQEPYISDLIEMEGFEIPETYKTLHEENAIHTGSFGEIKKEFTLDELKNAIKKDKAVIVELYDGHRTIAQEVITTFKDNRGTPLVKINPDANMEEIEFKEPSDIAIFSSAVSDSTVEPGISYIVYPEYIFSLGKESYFLWIAEDDGYIMNTKDTYTLYSLSNYSFEKVKGVIDYID